MKNAIALLVKFVVTLVAAWIVFSTFGTTTYYAVMIIAAAATLLNFAIGDMFVLKTFGNATASIINGIISAAAAYLILVFYPLTYFSTTSIYVFAVIVAVAEFFYHMYLLNSHIVEREKPDKSMLNKKDLSFNTETANELHPDKNNVDKGIYNEHNSSNYKNNTNRF